MHLEPWSEDDFPLLERLLGDPAMTEHLGGPESPSKLRERHERYLRTPTGVFKVVDDVGGRGVGWVGFWEREWREQQVYETGWSVLPELQGTGIAGAATRQAIQVACEERRLRLMHAFPAVDNAPSNAICRKLGFELVEELEFEYPPGNILHCNDWRLALW